MLRELKSELNTPYGTVIKLCKMVKRNSNYFLATLNKLNFKVMAVTLKI